MDHFITAATFNFLHEIFSLKKELIDLTKKIKEIKEEDVTKIQKEEQLSFASFIDDFKI